MAFPSSISPKIYTWDQFLDKACCCFVCFLSVTPGLNSSSRGLGVSRCNKEDSQWLFSTLGWWLRVILSSQHLVWFCLHCELLNKVPKRPQINLKIKSLSQSFSPSVSSVWTACQGSTRPWSAWRWWRISSTSSMPCTWRSAPTREKHQNTPARRRPTKL